MMKAGDTFLVPDRFGVQHLYVVLSDPQKLPDQRFPEHAYLVMLSTREPHKEDCCILRPGDHSFITHETIVVYKIPPAQLLTLSVLLKMKERGELLEREPVSSEILGRMRVGYQKSQYQRDDVKQFLFRQGAID